MASAQDLQTSAIAQTMLPVGPLAELGSKSLFDSDFGLAARLGYLGWIAPQEWPDSLNMIDLTALASYNFKLSDAFSLAAQLGLGTTLTFVEQAQSLNLGLMFLAEPGLAAELKLDTTVSLQLKFAWRFLFESQASYSGLMIGFGAASEHLMFAKMTWLLRWQIPAFNAHRIKPLMPCWSLKASTFFVVARQPVLS